MDNEILVTRIYLSESDQGRRRTLMQEILTLLQNKHAVQGVTVFRGIAGLGAGGETRADDILRLNVDLPIVIEFFDHPQVAEAAIRLLDGMVPGGHIVSWPAKRYGSTALPSKRR
jgi:uncharacterized protein